MKINLRGSFNAICESYRQLEATNSLIERVYSMLSEVEEKRSELLTDRTGIPSSLLQNSSGHKGNKPAGRSFLRVFSV